MDRRSCSSFSGIYGGGCATAYSCVQDGAGCVWNVSGATAAACGQDPWASIFLVKPIPVQGLGFRVEGLNLSPRQSIAVVACLVATQQVHPNVVNREHDYVQHTAWVFQEFA